MDTATSRLPNVQTWYWTAPRIAVGLFVLAVASLLWLLHRQELEEQHTGLISDTLWVEQNLRFQLSRSQEQLQQLGQDYFSGNIPDRRFEPRIKSLLLNNPGLTQVFVLDEGGTTLRGGPGPIGEAIAGEGLRPEPSQQAFRLARSTGNPVFSANYFTSGEWLFDIVVPHFSDGQHLGSIVAAYSIKTLLAEQVPWWFAQKYRLSVTDTNGAILGSKSNVVAGEETLSHSIPFDPPGYGLVLVSTAYKAETSLLRNLLALVIVGLGGGVLASLWAQRRHMKRRLDAEQALSYEYAFRKAMEDSLLTGLRARDLQGKIIYVNPAFCRMTGYSATELIGLLPPMPYWAPEEHENTLAVHRKAMAGLAPSEGVEVRLQRKNGERFDALIYEAPLIDASGLQTGWMGSVLDITERKRAAELARQQQEKLQFTARLVTMGEMASTLAHELNQPLSAIASYTTGCLNRLDAGNLPQAELREALGKLASQAQRAGRVIRRIYDFVRRSEPQRTSCDINEIAQDSIGLIEADARKRGMEIVPDLAANLPRIQADTVMLEQILLNLMRNGMEAMRATEAVQRHLVVSTALAENSLLVSVADHGSGISPEAIEHLFEPFYTTKPEGMGMGLNICRSIIESHKGRMWVEDNPKGGTIFCFTLPLEET
ncbi:MAG: PAS domain S-box protein [Betaproteobacteria bacterium]|nr:PAS domain S-box protein [Betaproteobacteria bacterium]